MLSERKPAHKVGRDSCRRHTSRGYRTKCVFLRTLSSTPPRADGNFRWMPRQSTPTVLTRRERQIMDVLYKKKQATAAQVLESMPDAPGYSAVRTLLATLAGFIKARPRWSKVCLPADRAMPQSRTVRHCSPDSNFFRRLARTPPQHCSTLPLRSSRKKNWMNSNSSSATIQLHRV
jgi:hypothetical protein